MNANVYPILCGKMENCDYSHNVYDQKFGEKVQAGMLGFLIQDQEHLLVFDTGPNMEKWKDRGVAGNPPVAFDEKLAQLGKSRFDVEYVVLSHLHSDHMGNWAHFPNAKIVVFRKEMAYAAAPVNPIYYDMQEIGELVAQGDRMEYLDRQTRLTPHVELLLVGAHTAGSMVALVHTDAGTVALAGDFVCVYENLQTRSITITDVDQWILALKELKRTADLILPGHELRVLEDYPAI